MRSKGVGLWVVMSVVVAHQRIPRRFEPRAQVGKKPELIERRMLHVVACELNKIRLNKRVNLLDNSFGASVILAV
jgi:hypothetical protein